MEQYLVINHKGGKLVNEEDAERFNKIPVRIGKEEWLILVSKKFSVLAGFAKAFNGLVETHGKIYTWVEFVEYLDTIDAKLTVNMGTGKIYSQDKINLEYFSEVKVGLDLTDES